MVAARATRRAGAVACRLFGCDPGVSQARGALFRQVLHEAEEREEVGREALRKAVRRRSTALYNKLMKNASDHRSVSLVQEAAECMRRDGVAENEWSVAVQVNAFARVGRTSDAHRVLSEAEARGLARSNNATVEPLVKALLEPRFVAHGLEQRSSSPEGRVLDALALVGERLGPGSTEPANHRTINTLLRGCKRWAPQLAPRVLRQLQPDSSSNGGGAHHPSTLALAAEVDCMALDSHAAAAAVHALAAQHHVAPDPRLLLELATTHALRGELQACSQLCSAVLSAVMRDGTAAPHTGGGGGRPHGGGLPPTPLPPMPRRGVPLGLLEAQRAMLTRFVAEGGVEGGVEGGGLGSGPHAGAVARGSHRSDMVSMLRGCSDTVSRPAHAIDAGNPDANADANADGAAADANIDGAAAADDRLRQLVSRSSRVCVEIGAGAGEWLVAQAAAHRDTAWIAIEPQLDRVHQLWCKVQLQRLGNVHICAADAAAALKLLPAAAVDAVHLRYPYPPPLELRDLTAPSPPSGIFLAASLLTDALRALRPGGELCFVTNEPACCALLLALVHAHPAAAQLRSQHGEAGFARILEAPRGPRGSSSKGSSMGSSSFFDAVLAERGHRKDHSEVRHERFSLTYTFHPPPVRDSDLA